MYINVGEDSSVVFRGSMKCTEMSYMDVELEDVLQGRGVSDSACDARDGDRISPPLPILLVISPYLQKDKQFAVNSISRVLFTGFHQVLYWM